MSPFAKGLLVGLIGYWAVQQFAGVGVTGRGKSAG